MQNYVLLANLAYIVTAGWLPKRTQSLNWIFLRSLFHSFMPKPLIWIYLNTKECLSRNRLMLFSSCLIHFPNLFRPWRQIQLPKSISDSPQRFIIPSWWPRVAVSKIIAHLLRLLQKLEPSVHVLTCLNDKDTYCCVDQPW